MKIKQRNNGLWWRINYLVMLARHHSVAASRTVHLIEAYSL